MSYLITVTWIVGITNAINWLDGLDGLASGLSSISFLGFLAVSLYSNNYGIAIINAIEKKLPNGEKNIRKLMIKTTMGKVVKLEMKVRK